MPQNEKRFGLGGLRDLLKLMHADLHQIIDAQRVAAKERQHLMTLGSDIKGQLASLNAKVQAQTNINTAFVQYVDGLKAANTDLQAKLDAALANSATPEELQEISDGFKALNDSIDAHDAADNAIMNTPVAGTPAADGSTGNLPA